MKFNPIIIFITILLLVMLFRAKKEGFLPEDLDFYEQEIEYFSRPTNNDNSGKWYEFSRIKAEVKKKVVAKNYSRLEEWVYQARTEKLRFKTTTWVLYELYDSISYSMVDYESIQKFVDKWRVHSPESNIPDIIEARAFYAKAWAIRKGTYSHKVSHEQNLGFRDYLKKSWDSLAIAANKGPVDPVVCTLQTELSFVYFRDKKLAQDYFNTCVTKEPSYVHLYIVAANYLHAKWYGSDEELLQFVEESTEATRNFYGEGLYALLVASLRDDNSKSFRIFKEDGGDFSWARTKIGFEDIFERFGESTHMLHVYGYCAMMAFDYKVFAEVLKKIGTEWNDTKENYYIKKGWYDFNLSRAKAYL